MHRYAFFRSPIVVAAALAIPAIAIAACSSSSKSGGSPTGTGGAGAGNSTSTGNGNSTGMGGGLFGDGGIPDTGVCTIQCSPDHHQVIDCDGGVVASCMAGQACDLSTGMCSDACTAAINNKQSVGCEFYATAMDANYTDTCFAAFIGNNWDQPVHITTVEFYPNSPTTNPITTFAVIPSGTGSNVTYAPYDPVAGLPPGKVAILFLSGQSGSTVPCPVPTAIPNGAVVQGTGTGHSFHIKTDLPVVAFQINPYGGGKAAITGASLLLPTSVWDTNYMGVTAGINNPGNGLGNPSLNIISKQDGTMVTIKPSADIMAGGTLVAGTKGTPYTFKLDQGQQAQFSQAADLTGTVIQATNPVGVMAGNACMQKPLGTNYCDHGEQMLPPVTSLGSEYVGVMWRPRVKGDQAIWRLVGALDGTTLAYQPSTPSGAPTTLNAGQVAEFNTDVPFVVTSDAKHPFMLFAQMSGSGWTQLSDTTGYGDPDFVIGVAPGQFLDDYVFMTDPTYPETNLVVVRAKDKSMMFQDVTLDCAGTLTGWQPVGNYEWTRIDLMSHDFVGQNGCSTGAHEMKSKGLFGLWVWGWGTPETTLFTKNVSYGYPGGMNVSPLNTIVIPANK